MTVWQLYDYLDEKIPTALSCDWDNDGLMCAPDGEEKVRRVLIALDITAAIVERAIREGYDVIISHHPLIFHPLKAINGRDPVAKKALSLLRAGISAMSFHTRLDAVVGGVNDTLAAALGLSDVVPFGENGEEIGRIGTLDREMTLDAFAERVKAVTGAPCVQVADAGVGVHRVALLGGGGSSDADAARAAGADTYLTGELKHNQLTDAPETGMNLIAAGHFYTENLICRRLAELVAQADSEIEIEIACSNAVRLI